MHVKHKFKVRMKRAKARVKTLIHGMLLNLIKVVLKHKLISYLTIKLTCTKTNSSLSKVSISRSRNQLKKSKPILLKSKINLSNSPSNNCNLETQLMISQLTKWVISKTRKRMLKFKLRRVSSTLVRKISDHTSKEKMRHLNKLSRMQLLTLQQSRKFLSLFNKLKVLEMRNSSSKMNKRKSLKDLMKKKQEIHQTTLIKGRPTTKHIIRTSTIQNQITHQQQKVMISIRVQPKQTQNQISKSRRQNHMLLTYSKTAILFKSNPNSRIMK